MHIYVEFKRDRLRVKTTGEEIEIKIPNDFYAPIPETESFEMFRNKETNNKLKDFIDRHRSNFKLLEKINYWFMRNRVLVLVDNEVQKLVTIEQLYSYGTLHLDGRVVSIIKKPETFDSERLERVESIQDMSINRRGKIVGDVVISKLS